MRSTASRLAVGRRRVVLAAVALVVVLLVLYGLVPQLPGLRRTLGRLDEGDGSWLAVAAGLEILSFAGYVVAFHAVFSGPGSRIDWRASYQLTMAGVVATRLLATGGAGGIALTAWGLTHAGFSGAEVTRRMAAFFVVLYSVFMAALVAGGLGLRTGVLPGPAPFGLTVVPAAFGGTAIVAALTLALVPEDLARRTERRLTGDGRAARGARALAMVPATAGSGVRGALGLLRTPQAVLGALAWWTFDIAVLWACLHAFGAAPPTAVVVVSYFVGQLGNLLPIPGGIGGVEGGMVGALLAFGVASSPAILAVLAYRAFAFWLPILPGAVAYVGLIRNVHAWDAEQPHAA
jgi:putative heme transporter